MLMWEEAAIKDDVIEYDIAFNIIYIMRTHVVVANLRCPSLTKCIRHQRRGLETLTTNSWAMLYGTLVMGAIALLRGDNFMPEWTVSYLGALLYLALFGSVIAFGAYFTLVGRIGASKAAYSTLLFPLVALSISTVYEGYVWHSNAVIGLALILLGNMVMFAKPEQLLLRRRLA